MQHCECHHEQVEWKEHHDEIIKFTKKGRQETYGNNNEAAGTSEKHWFLSACNNNLLTYLDLTYLDYEIKLIDRKTNKL